MEVNFHGEDGLTSMDTSVVCAIYNLVHVQYSMVHGTMYSTWYKGNFHEDIKHFTNSEIFVPLIFSPCTLFTFPHMQFCSFLLDQIMNGTSLSDRTGTQLRLHCKCQYLCREQSSLDLQHFAKIMPLT